MVERVRFGRTGLLVSKVAFGGIPIQRLSRQEGVMLVRGALDLGINFIDTAHGYGHSEELIGEAIQAVPRDEVVIATKSPASDRATLLSDLEESLRRLRTDHIEIFQLHGVNTREKMAAVLSPGGAVEAMVEAARAGKIRFLAFSSHSIPVAVEVIRTDRFDVVQIPFNFVDREAADRLIPMARKANLGIIAMKPLGGGLLDDARLCFRYLLQYPGVVPDPGIETLPQLREILEVLGSTGPLSTRELEEIERHRARLGSEWCHRCDYCQPCPEHISISTILVAKSFARRMPTEKVTSFVETAFANAESCRHCRECVTRCPYNLEIPDLLEKQRKHWDEYLRTGTWGTRAEAGGG